MCKIRHEDSLHNGAVLVATRHETFLNMDTSECGAAAEPGLEELTVGVNEERARFGNPNRHSRQNTGLLTEQLEAQDAHHVFCVSLAAVRELT